MPRIRQDNDNRYALRTSFVDDNGDVITGDTITISDITGYLQNVVEDTTPQLGGTLDGNGFNFNGAVGFDANAGEALSRGDAVYVSGVSGNKPVVMKADADDAAKMPAFGIASNDANLNANVEVVTFGTVYNIDTSAYSIGDELYVSTTPGVLTATPPTGESSKLQNLGKVIRSHATAGSIKVGGAGRTNAVPNLNDGNVFIGNASNQAEQRALVEADISDFGTYLTSYTETDTLATVTARGNTTSVNLITSANVKAGNGASDEGFFTGQKIYRSATGGSGLNFTNISTIRPTDNAGTNTNGTISLGESNYRFDNGYFNGSVTAGDLTVSAPSGDIITLADTNNTATSSNIGNVRIAWDDDAGTRVAYVGTTGTSDFWVLNGYGSVKLSYGGSERLATNGSGIDVTGVITADEFNTPVHQATNLAVGWYTIGYLASGRAGARFAVWDISGGRHQYCVLYASHMYGNNDSNTINILTYAVYSGSPIQKFRLKESGTYDGAALQVYIDDATNNVSASIVGDNVQSPGWTLADWVADATNPGVNGTWSSYVGRAEIDLADVGQGGISATGNILAGGDVLADGDVVVDGKLSVGGSAIGSRANSISVVGDDNSSTIASKTTSYDTVFSVLPWASGITYLSSGTYYDDGDWVHASDNAYSALFHIAGTGANWYASSNSSASWNLASNQVLWNSAGQWSNDVSLASDKDIILPLNNNDIKFQAANVDITANSGRSGVVRFANTAADTWTGFSSYTGGRDWQYLHRDGDCGIYDNTAGQWKIRHNSTQGTYFYYGSSLVTQTTSEGTYTDGIGTFATASGPAIKISDTSGTGATNHNSWLSFRDSGGTEIGYVGYGSGSDANITLSNYNNGVVNLQGTKASVLTSTGYIEIGSLNTSHAHFYTDRGSYYFNKLTYIDGSGLRGYDNSTDCRFPIYYDLQDTSYYCDPAGTSRFNVNYSNEHSTLAGNGYGLRFWNSDSYKIFMSTTTFGGQANGQDTSDYNIYFTMASGTNRGFVFRNTTTGLKAAIDGNARGYFERVHINNSTTASGGLTCGSQYLDVNYGSTGVGGIRLRNSATTIQGYWYANGSGEHGFLDNDGAWAVRCRTGNSALELRTNNNNEFLVYTSYVRAVGSCRSPIFYDFNNTSYYAHLDSTGDSIRAAGDIVAYYSDERLKDIEGPIENALDKVSTLNGFYYRGNKKAQSLGYDDKLKVGLSAQEVQKVLPEVIKSCPADNRYMTLDYAKVVPLLVEAIKELKSEIEELKK